MKKNFHSFEFVLNKLFSNPQSVYCVFENRPKKYRFGTLNYGEIPKWYNHADGDPWDVFAPGYNRYLKYNTPYQIEKIIGVFVLENGNHKIAVRLKDVPLDSHKFEKDIINKYTKNYTKYTKVCGKYVNLI